MTTRRTTTQIDFETGAVTNREVVTELEGVEERFAGLIADGEEHMPDAIMKVMWMRCDGCGAHVEVSEPKLPDGWITNPQGEFCSECQ